MVLYIHGFGSSGLANKATILKKYFGEENVFAPSLSHIPKLAIDTLEQFVKICKKRDDVFLIGASLGGYYASYLSSKYNLKAVLINPAIKPYEVLSKAVPQGINYYDNSNFDFRQEYLDELQEFKHLPNISKILLLLQKGDELLDYREALEFLNGSTTLLESDGNHNYLDFEAKLDFIKYFLELKKY